MIGHASLISDELKLPLEGRIHYVNARPDHAHLLIGTRVVEQGVLGPKQRALDAVSQKRAGEGLAVDGRLVGATIEKLRADWASRMREASGDLAIDHRSYLRRGIPISPVDTVPRGEIEFQKRRGRADWRRNRRAELEVRAAVLAEPGFWPQGAAVEADPTEPAPEDRQAVHASVLQTIAKRARAIASTTRKAREVADFVDPRATALQDAGIDSLAVQLLVDRFDRHKAGGAASKRAVEGDSHASIIADAVPATASPDLTAELLRIADEATAAGGVKVDAQAEAAELGSERRRVARASVLQRIADQTRALTSLARQADEVAEPIDPRATALKDAGIDLSTAQLMVGLANQRQTDTPASKRMTARDSYDPRVAETPVSAASPDVTTDMASFEATPVVEAARQDERSDPRARALSALASRISRDHHNDYNRPGAVDAAVAIYVGLNRAHRLSAARVEKLAAAVVLEVPSFEALARAAMTGKQPDVSPQTLTAPTSPVLLALLAAWDEEDRAARAERRHNKKQDRAASDSADAAPASSAPPMKASVRQPEVAASGPSNDRAVPTPAPPSASGVSRPDSIAPPPQPVIYAGPGAIAGSDVLARALYDAYERDILDSALKAKRPPPTDDDLVWMVALSLRATGRDHDEVGRLLLAGRPVLRSERVDRQVDQAVEKVSSSSVTEWIAEHPAFVARASRVGAQVETLLYRKLRTAALRQFERDLNDVWVERRRRADEVAARHRHTMAWIRDLRWRNRRLQKRGIVHAILSILVELAVLRPAIALERKTVGLKRQDLHDAARRATDRLAVLRRAWREECGISRPADPTRTAQRNAPDRQVEDRREHRDVRDADSGASPSGTMPGMGVVQPVDEKHGGADLRPENVRALAIYMAYWRLIDSATPNAEKIRAREIKRSQAICGLDASEFAALVAEVTNVTWESLDDKRVSVLRRRLWSEMVATFNRAGLARCKAQLAAFHTVHAKERNGLGRR